MNRVGELQSIFGFQVHKVPVGTVITDPVTGEGFEVTETNIVMSSGACWVTTPHFDAFKAVVEPKL